MTWPQRRCCSDHDGNIQQCTVTETLQRWQQNKLSAKPVRRYAFADRRCYRSLESERSFGTQGAKSIAHLKLLLNAVIKQQQ